MRIKSLRISAAWPYLTAAAALLFIAGWTFIRPVYLRGILEQNLDRAARMMTIGYASHIELAEFTDFPWTEVHIFAPYTPIPSVEAAAGSGWPVLASEQIETSDSITLLVFMNGDRITRWVEVDRTVIDFGSVAGEGPFSPETALFIMPVEGSSQVRLLR